MSIELPKTLLSSPIFIGGLMKSGTTLLRKILENHPSIYSGLETHWFSEAFQDIAHYREHQRHQWVRDFYELSDETVASLIAESQSGTEYLDRLMEFATRRAGKRRWLEKSPDNVFHIDRILQRWPDAKILITHRNLLDVFASWKKNKKSGIDRFVEVATQFQAQLQHYREDPCIHVVGYEALVRETRQVLDPILEFIEESFVQGLHEFRGDTRDYEQILKVTGKRSPTAASISRPIFDDSIGQWKQLLDEHEVAVLCRQFGASLKSE